MRAAILTLLLPIVATASSLAIRQLPTVPDACTSACDPVNTDLTTCSSMGSTESAAYLQCLCSAAVEADVTACYSCVGQNASGDLLTESQQASARVLDRAFARLERHRVRIWIDVDGRRSDIEHRQRGTDYVVHFKLCGDWKLDLGVYLLRKRWASGSELLLDITGGLGGICSFI
ncbi:hypothetical protein RQP46_004321 [Phenoliferia psychrophenolica]